MKTELSDGTILIRPYRQEDIDSLYEAARESIPEVCPWLPWCHPRYSREDSSAWIRWCEKAWRTGSEYNFAIFDAKTGRFLGGCGLNQFNRMHPLANLGYWVRSSSTGRGVATAATLLTARFGFEELRLNRIEIVVALGNQASRRVAEKAGAKKEGVLRRRLLIHGQAHEAVLYSLIPEDFGPSDRAGRSLF